MKHPDIKQITSTAIRFLVYAIVMLIAVMTIHWDGKQEVALAFGENSMTEYLQELYLLITALLFAFSGKYNKDKQGFTILLSGFFLVLFIREFDWLFDKIVHGFWQYPALLVTAVTIGIALKFKATIVSAMASFTRQTSFGTFISGFLTMMLFSRLFGKGTLWKSLMGDHYIRSVKNAVEEGTELLGYSLILISAIEYFISMRKKPEIDQ